MPLWQLALVRFYVCGFVSQSSRQGASLNFCCAGAVEAGHAAIIRSQLFAVQLQAQRMCIQILAAVHWHLLLACVQQCM